MAFAHPIMTKSALPGRDIGDYTYGVPTVIGKGPLTIGKFTSIADGVKIFLDADHRGDWVTTYPFPALFADAEHIKGHPTGKGPVTIGHDVWIGHGAMILSGVTIGNGAIIAAGSVVTKNVPRYAVVAGNPAQVKKYRFAEEWCEYLNSKLRWWDWPMDTILGHIDALLQPPGDHLFQYSKKFGGKK